MYRFTSIARPIDPAYLTNRALLMILPLLMLASGGLASLYDMGDGPAAAAFSGALAAFAAWALTRELAPDYSGAAFVALALAWAANIALEASSVMLLFVALLLVRLVNRSTGPQWRLADTFGCSAFAFGRRSVPDNRCFLLSPPGRLRWMQHSRSLCADTILQRRHVYLF